MQVRRLTLIWLMLLLSWAMLGAADAATYYVSPSGSNGNSCSTAQSPGSSAKQTISAGVSCLSGGDTLRIQAGLYTEGEWCQAIPNGTLGNYTKIDRYLSDVVRVRPTAAYINACKFSDGKAYIEVAHLILDARDVPTAIDVSGDCNEPYDNCPHHIRFLENEMDGSKSTHDNSGSQLSGGPGFLGGSNIEFIRNDMHDSLWYGIYFAVTDSLIDGNSIHDANGYGIHNYSVKGGVSRNIIRNNIFYNNGFSVPGCWGGCQHPTIIVGSGDDNQVYNNVINHAVGGIQVAYGTCDNIKVFHNTIYDTTAGECIHINAECGGAEARNNICYQTLGIGVENPGGVQQSNNLTSDPGFVNAAGGIFKIGSAGSPAVSPGGPRLSQVQTDLEGRARNDPTTLGAYEFAASSPPSFTFTASTPVPSGSAPTLTWSPVTSDGTGLFCTASVPAGGPDTNWTGTTSGQLMAGGTKSGATMTATRTYRMSCSDSNGPSTVPDRVVTVVPTCNRVVYDNGGARWTMPGTLEAEHFDTCSNLGGGVTGEGTTHHDLDSSNISGSYRLSEDVDVNACAGCSNGQDVAYIRAGEWMEYLVNFTSSGNFTFTHYVSYNDPGAGGTFHLEIDRVAVGSTMSIPNTGSWTTYTTVSTTANVASGPHTIRISFDTGGNGGADLYVGNFDRLVVALTSSLLVANFTGTPLTGAIPLPVTFTDSSTGTITSRAWTFGDGGTSTATNPSHTYTTAGTYTVALTVTGPSGSNTFTWPSYITVFNAGANTFYVSNGGSGSTCSVSLPCASIQTAVNLAFAGDTVSVASGFYPQLVSFPRSGTSGNPITFTGTGASTILDGGQPFSGGWTPAGGEPGSGTWQRSGIPFLPVGAALNDKVIAYVIDPANAALDVRPGKMSWEAIIAYWYHYGGNTVYFRQESGAAPTDALRFSNSSTVDINNRSYIVVKNFTIRNGETQINIRNGSHHVIVENSVLRGGKEATVTLAQDGGNNEIRSNDIAWDFIYPGCGDPADPKGRYGGDSADNCWAIVKSGQFYGGNSYGVREHQGGNNNRIYNNHIHHHFDAWSNDPFGANDSTSSGVRFYNNTVDYMVDNAIQISGQAIDYQFYDNTFTKNYIDLFRVKGIGTGPVYVYRNKFTNAFHENRAGPSASPLYVYHNSFTATASATYESYSVRYDGCVTSNYGPDAWFVNNIFSGDRFLLRFDECGSIASHYDYNWVGGGVQQSPPPPTLLSHNVIATDQFQWSKTDPPPDWNPSGGARNSGINLSQNWTVDGVTHGALPGMTPGYFSGAAPHMGAVQDVTSPPAAIFTGTPLSGTVPLNVAFTDASTGVITSRSWTFGDGGTSTATNPSHNYTTAGTYTVALTVTGPDGSNTQTRPTYITVSSSGLRGTIVKHTFEEGSGTTAADSSGNPTPHPCTMNTAGWATPGIIGSFGMDANGARECHFTSTADTRPAHPGMSVWIRCPANASGYSYAGDMGAAWGLWFDPTTPTSQPHAFVITPGGVVGVTGTGNLFTNIPHMVTWTLDNLGLRLWVDAVQVGFTPTTAAPVYTGSEVFYWGKAATGGPDYLTGCVVDQGYLFDTPLTQAQVDGLFNDAAATSGMSQTHMRAYVDAAEGTPLSALDSDISLLIGTVFGLRFAIHNVGSTITEYFPLWCARNGGAFVKVTNSFGSLGLRIADSTFVNMGDLTTVPLPGGTGLPLDGFAPVRGRFVADVIDPTLRTTIASGQHTEWEYRVQSGSPAVAGDTFICEPRNEADTVFTTYNNLKSVALQSIAAPSSIRLGGDMKGGTSK